MRYLPGLADGLGLDRFAVDGCIINLQDEPVALEIYCLPERLVVDLAQGILVEHGSKLLVLQFAGSGNFGGLSRAARREKRENHHRCNCVFHVDCFPA